jgi:tetratricopeptide (TPR) repeat protein
MPVPSDRNFNSEFLQRHPSEIFAYYLRAVRFWYNRQLGRPQIAVGDRTEVLEIINKIPNARELNWSAMHAYTRNGLGAALAALGDCSKSSEEFGKSADLQPENAWVYFNRAHLHEKLSDNAKALTDYQVSLSKSKPKLPAYKRAIAEKQVQE